MTRQTPARGALPRWLALLLALPLLLGSAPLAAHAVEGSSISLDSATVARGGTVTVTYETDQPDAKNWIGIYRPGDSLTGGITSRSYQYVTAASGSVTFAIPISTDRFDVADYDVYLFARDGYTQLAGPERFTIVEATEPDPDPAGGSRLSLSADSVAQGESVTVTYETDQPHAKNWIGIYRVSDGEPDGSPGSRDWDYAPGESGSLTFRLTASTFAPGEYRVWFLAKDGYGQLGDPVDLEVTLSGDALAPVTDTASAQNARVGEPFSVRVEPYFKNQSGLAATYAASGAGWLSLADGVLSGTPTAAGVSEVELTATVADQTVRTTLRIRVVGADDPLVDRLTVLSYNSWQGSAPIRQTWSFVAAQADVVTIQEARDGSVSQAAEALGWQYTAAIRDCAVISRYPILQTYAGTGDARAVGVLIQLDPVTDRKVWVYSAHLAYTPYGPYYARDGRTVQQILDMENAPGQRTDEMVAILEQIEANSAATPGVPVLLTGDFNTPSHLDWVESTRASHYGLVVPYPVTVAAEQAGFLDSFRVAHPDPAADPGTTWTPLDPREPQDRIDFILVKGDRLRTAGSQVFTGPSLADWASDHAGVLSSFDWVAEAIDPGEEEPGGGEPGDGDPGDEEPGEEPGVVLDAPSSAIAGGTIPVRVTGLEPATTYLVSLDTVPAGGGMGLGARTAVVATRTVVSTAGGELATTLDVPAGVSGLAMIRVTRLDGGEVAARAVTISAASAVDDRAVDDPAALAGTGAEPWTAALVAAGLLALGTAFRRRRTA